MVDDVKTMDDLGDDKENYEGYEEDTHEKENIDTAYYDEENPAYQEENESNESDEFLEGFEEGVKSDTRPVDDWTENQE